MLRLSLYTFVCIVWEWRAVISLWPCKRMAGARSPPRAAMSSLGMHFEKPARVTVLHPKRGIPIGTLKSIEKQAGLKLR
ncbi:hypothetical protein AF71_00032700 [Rhizobium sp. 57MFTsu3.2]|nr:hypothetical protein [Rhizobium sp. 57MFTsu3.2]